MIDRIVAIDNAIVRWIGDHLFDHYWGWISRILTNPEGSVLVSILAIVILCIQLRWRGLRIALHVAVVVGLTNLVSSEFLKDFVKRPRPCVESQSAHFSTACHNLSQSFPSSHSANSMAIAVTAFSYSQPYGAVLTIGSLTIGFARVYLGVHYPTDVLAGWILGALVAWIFGKERLKKMFRQIGKVRRLRLWGKESDSHPPVLGAK